MSSTNSDDLYVVTFAGFVVEVCASKADAEAAAAVLLEKHPEGTIGVGVMA
jgi:hypothetical protein